MFNQATTEVFIVWVVSVAIFCLVIYVCRAFQRAWHERDPTVRLLIVTTDNHIDPEPFLDTLRKTTQGIIGAYPYTALLGVVNSTSPLVGEVAVVLTQPTLVASEIDTIAKRLPDNVAIHVIGIDAQQASIPPSYTLGTHRVRCWLSYDDAILPLVSAFVTDIQTLEGLLDISYEKAQTIQV